MTKRPLLVLGVISAARRRRAPSGAEIPRNRRWGRAPAEQHGWSTDIGQTEQQEDERRAVEGSEDTDAHLVVLDVTTACPLDWLRTQHCTARPPDVACSDGGPAARDRSRCG